MRSSHAREPRLSACMHIMWCQAQIIRGHMWNRLWTPQAAHSWLACRCKSRIVTNTKTMQQATHAHAATDDTANTFKVWYAPEEQRLRPFRCEAPLLDRRHGLVGVRNHLCRHAQQVVFRRIADVQVLAVALSPGACSLHAISLFSTRVPGGSVQACAGSCQT